MLNFLFGLMCGGMFGVFTMCLVNISKREDS